MPDQPDSNNKIISLRLPRELHRKVQKAAAQAKMDVSAYIRMVLAESTLDVQLTPEEIMQIAKEVQNAEQKKRNR